MKQDNKIILMLFFAILFVSLMTLSGCANTFTENQKQMALWGLEIASDIKEEIPEELPNLKAKANKQVEVSKSLLLMTSLPKETKDYKDDLVFTETVKKANDDTQKAIENAGVGWIKNTLLGVGGLLSTILLSIFGIKWGGSAINIISSLLGNIPNSVFIKAIEYATKPLPETQAKAVKDRLKESFTMEGVQEKVKKQVDKITNS